jgi:putative flippase GtrA
MPVSLAPEAAMPEQRGSRRDAALQFVLYLFVGGMSFLADMVVFLALLPLGYMVALIPGFAVGTLTNYGLSRLIAFRSGRHAAATELAMLVAVAVAGAVMTVILVVGMVELGMDVVHAKVVATPIVLAWNFLARKYLVFRSELPERIERLLGRREKGGRDV